MRYARFAIYGILAILIAIGGSSRVTSHAAAEPVVQFVREPADAARETDEKALRRLLGHVMDICGTPTLSPARRAIVADQVIRVTMARDVPQEYREAFVEIVCIESRFDPTAKSSAGAIGLSQIMPQYAQRFADLCEMGKLTAVDVQDPETNLRLGSCLYFHLLEYFGGNRTLASSAYNSGADSKTTKSVARLGTGHPETMGYVTRFYALDEQIRKASK